LTGATRNRCPECDTPFRPADVIPHEDVMEGIDHWGDRDLAE
jgi:hypothetical protein